VGKSQLGTARFSNLLALAIIALTALSLIAVVADNLLPGKLTNNRYLAELCLGQRVSANGSTQIVWLQGVWLVAPPLPKIRYSAGGQDFNNPGTVCGLLPWFSGSPGWWYKEIK
jgi:hypothetical protein